MLITENKVKRVTSITDKNIKICEDLFNPYCISIVFLLICKCTYFIAFTAATAASVFTSFVKRKLEIIILEIELHFCTWKWSKIFIESSKRVYFSNFIHFAVDGIEIREMQTKSEVS